MAKSSMGALASWITGGIATVRGWVDARSLSTSSAATEKHPIRERDFGAYPARASQYALMWALWENTAYDSKVHHWADKLRKDRGMYPRVRNLFSVVYRLVEFWAVHIWPGSIDPACGDGVAVPSAIPIVSDSAAIPPAVARVLADSDFQANKTVCARLGAALGSVGLFAVDDVAKGLPRIEVVDPAAIVAYHEEADGTATGYILEEWHPDPRPEALPDAWGELPRVRYREVGELIRDASGTPTGCRFRTFLDNEPYGWPANGLKDDWDEPYPFVPLTLIAHAKVVPRCPFGVAEALPALAKIFEVDEVASRFHGLLAKHLNTPWLFAGVPPGTLLEMDDLGPDDIPALYGGTEARAQALLAAVDLSHVDGHITLLVEEIEKDYPELVKPIESAAGDASGAALRESKKRCEAKGQTRRAGYDAGLVKAIVQCLRIGGLRGYDGYEAFGPDAPPESFRFRIADRPVFMPDAQDKLDMQTAMLANLESADRAGIPVLAAVELLGMPKEWAAIIKSAQDDALSRGLAVGRSKQAAPPNDAAAEAIQAPGGAAP